MAREIELKLEFDPANAGRLMAHAPCQGHREDDELLSLYFDTPKRKLRKNGWVLRLRQNNSSRVQTIKHSGECAGLFDRDEWETEVKDLRPDPQAVAGTPLNRLIKSGQLAQLEPVVRSDIRRSSWAICKNGGTIELTCDNGLVEAGGKSAPVHELELELKAGDVSTLFATAKRISRAVPVRLGVLAKSERGFALVDGSDDRPAKAKSPDLSDEAAIADGFAAIVSACLKHFRLNEPIFLRDHNAEALHQLRVAVRRLRTALWLFKPAVADSRFASISRQLRGITREFGAARNIDVILASLPARDPAREQLEQDRIKLYGKIERKLNSRAFRGFVIDLLAWTYAGEWRQGKKAGQPLLGFALKRVDRLWRRIDRAGDKLASLSPEKRHHLRIDAKKLRYALEFLQAPLRGAAGTRSEFGRAAEGLQDALGLLNDLAVRQQLLAQGRSETGREAARHLRMAKRCFKEISKIGPYWRDCAD